MQQSLSQHSFCMLRHKIQAGQGNYVVANNYMSQQSSDKAQWLKKKFCRHKEFFCRDIIEEECKENCRDNS